MLAMALVLLAVRGLHAQGGPQNPPPRDEAFKIIDAYVMSNLQESLGLSDEQFVRLLPLVKKLQDERRAFAQRRMRAVMELRQAFRAGRATEAHVAERLRELKDVEVQEPAAVRRHRDAIDGALTPVQQAKFRVMEVEVEQRIRQLMSRVRQDAAPRRGPRGGAGEDRPDDRP
jgi:hypothetical protein